MCLFSKSISKMSILHTIMDVGPSDENVECKIQSKYLLTAANF